MTDSGIIQPEGIPIRDVQEYTTHTWRSWKRRHVYLVNVTFFRQEKVKQVYVFQKSATKVATFHSDKLLRESRRGLAHSHQNNTSYRYWCVLSNMLIVPNASNGQNTILCVSIIGTSSLSFISQDDLGNQLSTPTKNPITNPCTRLIPQSVQFYTNVTIWKGLEAKYVCTCDCKDTSATVNKSINESQLRLPCDCMCDVYSVVFPAIGSSDLNKIIFDLKKSLSIPKPSLTAYHRSKTSISDQRPEAVVMGSFAVMILIICALLIFLLDIGNWRTVKRRMKRKTKKSLRRA
ncbi:unnamed protein product [Mytilus coruscus]|uniref:Uncharacterized protein n=1 Tax=Mytilus coruscus TaxID=42192 RepID=A0A6J8BJB4_MYTCO|nr:unnamed protein product [Mytilus coruscus]